MTVPRPDPVQTAQQLTEQGGSPDGDSVGWIGDALQRLDQPAWLTALIAAGLTIFHVGKNFLPGIYSKLADVAFRAIAPKITKRYDKEVYELADGALIALEFLEGNEELWEEVTRKFAQEDIDRLQEALVRLRRQKAQRPI